MPSLRRWIRRATRTYRPDWHRQGVGGRWEQIGRRQFDYLVEQGLRPDHYLLDIGCGSLRGGIHFISYLAPGHYFGIEKESDLVRAATEIEIPRNGLTDRRPVIIQTSDFDLTPAGDTRFDYMIAQSVFTHMTPEMISLCLARVAPHLASGGRLFATFAPAEDIRIGKPHVWRQNEIDVAWYPSTFFEGPARNAGLRVEYLGEWGHLRGQEMLVFTRPSEA